MAQVRFQPRLGHFLAAASDKVVSIFDVETDRQLLTFQVLLVYFYCSGNCLDMMSDHFPFPLTAKIHPYV